MSNPADFLIENGILTKYTGNAKEVVIPEGITEIGTYAFYENLKLETVVIPESIRVIAQSAFELCRKLESVRLPQGLTQIGSQAFRLCRKLKSIEIPGSCQSTGSEAFFGCSSLEAVVLGEGIREIGSYCFVNCSALTRINWPESLLSIKMAAFNGCSSLPEVTLPSGVTDIAASAFGDCGSLEKVIVSQAVMDSIDSKWFRSRFNKVDLNLLWLAGKTNFDKRVGDLCAKSILRKKEDYWGTIIRINHGQAMANFLSLLEKVPIDVLDRYLEDCSAKGAAEVSAVLLEYKNRNYSAVEVEQEAEDSTLKALGFKDYAVADWRKIFKFSISDGDATITGYKGNQTSVLIPAKIGKNRVVTFSLASMKGRKMENAEICEKITDVTIEPGVLGVGENAFTDCKALQSLVLPEGMEAIDYYAFLRCPALEEIHIPASVTNISSSAFRICPKLTIHAPAGSYAETYAKENNIPFVAE